jgi:hypothetical protein
MRAGEWGKPFHPAGVPERIPLPEGSLLVDYVAGGGGFGDPTDRDPEAVLKDFTRGWVSRETAERIYGVILERNGKSVDAAETETCRRQIREARRQSAKAVSGKTSGISATQAEGWRQVLRFHAVLEVGASGKRRVIRCSRCGHLFCNANENYKLYALHRSVHLKEIMPPLPTGEPYIGEHHEYFCPGCATQLQVDLFCPPLGGDPILWDTRIQ